MRQTFHIFQKDVRLYWIEIAATLTVTALFVWVYPSTWADASHRLAVWPWVPGAVTALVPISWLVLITRVIHAESLVGERQFWITRPYRWPELMAAKALLILIFVYMPFFAAQCHLLRAAGMKPSAHLPGLLFNLLLTTGIAVLPMASLAAVTSNFAKMLFGLLAVILFAAGMAYTNDLLPASSNTNPFGDELSFVGPVSVFIAVLVIQYARRKVALARALLVALALAIGLLGLFGPEDTMMRVTYPVSSDHQGPSLALAPVAAPTSEVNSDTSDERQITLMLPVRIGGIPPETVVRVDNARVAIRTARGQRWISHWQGQYLMWLPGQTDGTLSLKVSHAFYRQAKQEAVSIDLSLALTMLKSGKATRIAIPKGSFQIPGGGVCTALGRWTNDLSCLYPLRQPRLLMAVTRFSKMECSAIQPANDGDPGLGWIGNLDAQPADFGITSVWQSNVAFERFSSSKATERHYLCPGSPLSFVAYEVVSRREQDISGQLPNLQSVVAFQF